MNKIKKRSSCLIIVFLMSLATCDSTDSNIQYKTITFSQANSVWISRNFKTVNFSLLEYLILEGRADSFAESVYPGIESPWTNIFGLEKEQEVWYVMKNVLNSRDTELNMRMVVGEKDIPFASAYTIGHRLMQQFLKNNPLQIQFFL